MKNSLEQFHTVAGRDLDSVQKNELQEIDNYLKQKEKDPEKSITSIDLRNALHIVTSNVFSDLVKK